MEQQTLLPKNKTVTTLLIAVVVVVLGIIATIVNRYWAPITGAPLDTNTEETVSTIPAAQNQEQVGNVLTSITSGKGELTFVVSAKTGSIVREIQLYNPYKGSWIIIYDGYKTVGETPVEVFKAGLAAMTYSKVQVRTLDRFFTFDRPTIVTSGITDTVILHLE